MAAIDSSSIPPQFSEDAGANWLTLVCTKDWSLNGTTPSTDESTYCGTVTAVGTPSYKGAASAVGEFAPGVTSVSMEKAQSWWLNKTPLLFKAQYPAGTGTDFHVNGTTMLTDFNATFGAAGTSTAFDIAWTITTPDITP